MAKKITAYIKLEIKAQGATPQPPIGPALGQRGLNIMEFCKQFNAKTQGMEKDAPTPVVITAYEDRSFTFIIKKPPVSYYLKKAAKLSSGSKLPGRTVAGKVSLADVTRIAEEKLEDMNSHSLESAINEVKGTARSMGLEVVGA